MERLEWITVDEIVELAIDKVWLDFEMRFIEWEAEFKAKFL